MTSLYNFDASNIKWKTVTLPTLGELEHLLYSITAVRLSKVGVPLMGCFQT
jgi:hypothetical protein